MHRLQGMNFAYLLRCISARTHASSAAVWTIALVSDLTTSINSSASLSPSKRSSFVMSESDGINLGRRFTMPRNRFSDLIYICVGIGVNPSFWCAQMPKVAEPLLALHYFLWLLLQIPLEFSKTAPLFVSRLWSTSSSVSTKLAIRKPSDISLRLLRFPRTRTYYVVIHLDPSCSPVTHASNKIV